MHAEVGFMLHPLVDADANSRKERVQQNRDQKGSHDHPLPWFEKKQCQEMHAEVGFKLLPLADSNPQISAAEKIWVQGQDTKSREERDRHEAGVQKRITRTSTTLV